MITLLSGKFLPRKLIYNNITKMSMVFLQKFTKIFTVKFDTLHTAFSQLIQEAIKKKLAIN